MTKAELNEQWAIRLKDYKKSGQTLANWCTANNINTRTMSNWVKKEKDNPKQSDNQTRWLAVDVDSEKSQKSLTVRIGFASIEIKAGYDPKLLLDVAKTLSTIC